MCNNTSHSEEAGWRAVSFFLIGTYSENSPTANVSNVGCIYRSCFPEPHSSLCSGLLSAQHSQTLPPAYYLITLSFWPKCQKLLILMRLVLLSSARKKGTPLHGKAWLNAAANASVHLLIHPTNPRCSVKGMLPGQEEQLCLHFLPHPLLPEPAKPFEGESTRVFSFSLLWNDIPAIPKMNWLLVGDNGGHTIAIQEKKPHTYTLHFKTCGRIEVYKMHRWKQIIYAQLRKSELTFLIVKCFSISSQFSSVTQSCLTLCDPRNCSMPGLPVHHQLLEFTETHIHRVSDAIQPSYPLLSPSPPASIPSQH